MPNGHEMPSRSVEIPGRCLREQGDVSLTGIASVRAGSALAT
nr:hypothetical protein JVH1_7422 [Rhodococcus sp. JVH1]